MTKSNYGSDYGGRGEVAKSVHNAAKHGNVSHKAYAGISSVARRYGW